MRIGIVIILVFFIAGCKEKHDLPSGILKGEKMQAVLWDVMLAEAYTTQYIKRDSLKNDSVENAKLQQQIFAIHNVSKKEFYDSYNYYRVHEELMRSILDSLTLKGEREKEKAVHGKLPTTNTPRPILVYPAPETAPEKIMTIPTPLPKEIQTPTVPSIQNSLPPKNSRPVFPTKKPFQ